MRVAIVHEWLVTYAGSERVLEQIVACYPNADIFCTVDFLPESERGFLENRVIRTSFIQKLPFARTRYRSYLPLMPIAIEQFDLSGYDLVISSNHAVAKGAITGPDQTHICLCHSPIRYAWDLQHQYLKESGMSKGVRSLLARWVLHKIRLWDFRTSASVDKFVAVSKFIQRRIWRAYRRESLVIYPPVDVSAFVIGKEKSDFYLAASRMVSYKRMDLIVEAFSQLPERNLVVIGDGPDLEKVRAIAGPNVKVLGAQPLDVLRDNMQRARAFLFAAEEDFGIIPIEAQACGTPVIAYGKGGVLETIIGDNASGADQTGIFFPDQNVPSIISAIREFENLDHPIQSAACRKNAIRFSVERFRQDFSAFVAETMASQQQFR